MLTPPNIELDAIWTLTLLGKNIFVPPNTDVAFITWSWVKIDSLKSKSIPPKIEFKLAPLNSSPANLNFWPENVA